LVYPLNDFSYFKKKSKIQPNSLVSENNSFNKSGVGKHDKFKIAVVVDNSASVAEKKEWDEKPDSIAKDQYLNYLINLVYSFNDYKELIDNKEIALFVIDSNWNTGLTYPISLPTSKNDLKEFFESRFSLTEVKSYPYPTLKKVQQFFENDTLGYLFIVSDLEEIPSSGKYSEGFNSISNIITELINKKIKVFFRYKTLWDDDRYGIVTKFDRIGVHIVTKKKLNDFRDKDYEILEDFEKVKVKNIPINEDVEETPRILLIVILLLILLVILIIIIMKRNIFNSYFKIFNLFAYSDEKFKFEDSFIYPGRKELSATCPFNVIYQKTPHLFNYYIENVTTPWKNPTDMHVLVLEKNGFTEVNIISKGGITRLYSFKDERCFIYNDLKVYVLKLTKNGEPEFLEVIGIDEDLLYNILDRPA